MSGKRVFIKVEMGKIKHKWNCTKCKEVFSTSIKLRSHRKIHRQEESDVHYNYRFDDDRNLYICNTCDTEISSKEEIENHIIEHEDKFVCEICKQNFYKPYEFSCHIYKHDTKKGFNCPLCKYETNRRTDIWKHIKIRHLHKYKYNCVKCGKGFTNRVLFTEHNNIHEGVKPFVCVVCSKSFVYSSYLYNHQIHNHLVNIGATQCTICFKSFVQKKSLRKHLRSHEMMGEKLNKEKKHLCDICGKGFAQNEKLKIHYRVHTGDKPYSCSYCGKSFTKRDYLVMHERVHSGEKPYACEYCGKRFNQGAPLRLHIRSHTGERPYKCHLCNNGFISRSVLNLHLKNCLGVSD